LGVDPGGLKRELKNGGQEKEILERVGFPPCPQIKKQA